MLAKSPRRPSLAQPYHGLWSLWDMIERYGLSFFVISKGFANFQASPGEATLKSQRADQFAKKIGSQLSAVDMARDAIVQNIDLIESLSKIMEWPPSVAAQCERIKAMLDLGTYSLDEFKLPLGELCSRFEDELGGQWFLHIKPSLLDCYQKKQLFGEDVEGKFPNASEDIENAGKCMAVGQETAAVFHLMRAMEVAVGALASKFAIQNPSREWGKLLSDIHAKIVAMPKGDERDSWSECHANLYHVKQAWRNKTMHPKATYTPEQAMEVFRSTGTFMRQLATLL